MQKNYKQALGAISTFVFDLDGVLTDGSLLIGAGADPMRRMHSRDAYALKQAREKGYTLCIINENTQEGDRNPLKQSGLGELYLNAGNKETALEEFLWRHNIPPAQVLYMGDDLPDIPPMKKVAIAACPQDAAPEVKAIAHYVSHKAGGAGCVRDIIEQVLKVRGHWQSTNGSLNQ